jgi:prepilin-type N-terminal cleavage/methylation domain-containing protein
MQLKRSRAGFTLIELMVVVGILGVLSAIAVPSFIAIVRRSKTAETAVVLNAMFKSAASYYASERAAQSQTATLAGHCTINDAGPSPDSASAYKQPFVADPNFTAIGFTIADQVYYSYTIWAHGTAGCDHPANSDTLYTFEAKGDLDGDGITSRFELAAGSDASNTLYHQQAIFIDHETE